MINNIVSVYERATSEEVEEGLNWYPVAHRLALDLSDNLLKGAGVISALSPRKTWNLNQRLAIRAFEDGTASGQTGVQCAKANAIMALDIPTIDEVMVILGGEKTQNFFLNIVDPYSNNVTVDRHAHDIYMGKVYTDATRPNIGKKRYAEISNAYLEAAKVVGHFPLELQAITWVRWRNEKLVK